MRFVWLRAMAGGWFRRFRFSIAPINLDGQSVPMGGIGSVFTLKEYRHKGVASALMRLAVDTMLREGFEVSLLFAERLTFYNQFGWREVDRKFSILAAAASLDVPDRFVIDSFETERDLAEIAAIHRGYSGRFNVTAVRDDSAWRANLKFAGNQPLHPGEGSEEYFVVCRDDARIAAYARVTRFHGVSMVMEYGYIADGIGIEAMLATFKYLGQSAAGVPVTVRANRRSSARHSAPQRIEAGRAKCARHAYCARSRTRKGAGRRGMSGRASHRQQLHVASAGARQARAPVCDDAGGCLGARVRNLCRFALRILDGGSLLDFLTKLTPRMASTLAAKRVVG